MLHHFIGNGRRNNRIIMILGSKLKIRYKALMYRIFNLTQFCITKQTWFVQKQGSHT